MEARFKISVWWDMNNGPVPKGNNSDHIIHNIHSALHNINYALASSPSSPTPTPVAPPFHPTGPQQHLVSLIQIPTGVKDARVRKILVDMLVWAVDNPAPANILLISRDTGFSNVIYQLHQRKYIILLAHPPQVWRQGSRFLFGGTWTTVLSPKATTPITSFNTSQYQLCPSLVSIFAYTNTRRTPLSIQQQHLVSLIQIPTGVKDACVRKILVDMLVWVVDNPTPANILQISEDTGFSDAIYQLHQRKYTIL